MRLVSSALAAVGFLAPWTSHAAGDTTSPGFLVESQVAFPPYASFATHPHGGILVFDGDEATLRFPPLGIALYLGSTPSFVYPSFVLVHPTQGFALLGESSNGNVLATDFASGNLVPLTQIPFNYDAVWEDSQHFLLSAAPCVLFCGSDILRVDASTGARTPVAHVVGPSGPLALSAAGDLYYGRQPTTYPPPPGSLKILRWTRAQVQSGTPLTENDAAVLVTGLDGISSIAIDPERGHLWVAESRFPGGSTILEYRIDGSLVGPVVASPDWIGHIEIASPARMGRVHRFGVRFRLRYAAVDYNAPATARLVTVIPTRPPLPRAHW